MKVYSPSYLRAETVKTHKIIPDVIYCVHEFEAKDYLSKGYKVEVLPNETKGNIARVRNWIKYNLIGDKGLIIDDDVEGILQWSFDEEGIPVQKQVEEIDEMIENGFLLCEELGACLWGLNLVSDKGSYREYTPFAFKSTVSGSFMGFVNCTLSFDESIPLKEDYDFCIQVLNKHRKLLRINYLSLVKKDHKNVGGCADYRTINREKEQMDLLINKWGSKIVRMEEKKSNHKVIDINPIIKVPIKGV